MQNKINSYFNLKIKKKYGVGFICIALKMFNGSISNFALGQNWQL